MADTGMTPYLWHHFRRVVGVHRILCIHLGTPPERFLWQWADKDSQPPRPARQRPGRRSRSP